MDVVGEITCEKNGHFVWNIENFRQLWQVENFCSPNFTYLGVVYFLELEKLSNTNIYASLYELEYSGTVPNSLYIEFQFRTDSNIVSDLHGSRWQCENYGTGVSVSIEEFVSKESGTSLPDRLTVHCWMRELNCSDELRNFEKLQKDFEQLLLNTEDSDITLEVQGIEFPAHRNILRARSPVFNVMFKHKMKEANSNTVTIEDSDPKTFPDFLKYLYTGSTKHVSQGNVCQLYTTSDKYEVLELKAKCAEFMKNHISVENFCEFFFLAHMHKEEELILSGIEFFCSHSIEIAKTAKWQMFLTENSTIGNELFLEALLRIDNIKTAAS